MTASPMPSRRISAATVAACAKGSPFPGPRSDQPWPGRSRNSISARPSSSGLAGTIWSSRLPLAPWMKTTGGRSAFRPAGTWT